jgi:hypothetical protein
MEEHVNEPDFMHVLTSIVKHLRKRGFRVTQDPKVKKRWPDIAKWHYYGRKHDLEVEIGLCGRSLDIKFFQNLVYENRNGGQYDFNKYAKMPYLMRLQFLNEAVKLVDMLLSAYQYDLSSRLQYRGGTTLDRVKGAVIGLNVTDDPLRYFNDKWEANRFRRDETGWPVSEEYQNPHNTDREGVLLSNGMTRYYRDHKGYLRRAVIWTNMNSRWYVVCNREWTCVSSWELFTPQPGETWRKCVSKEIRQRRISGLLKYAVKEMAFEQAAVYRDLLQEAAA